MNVRMSRRLIPIVCAVVLLATACAENNDGELEQESYGGDSPEFVDGVLQPLNDGFPNSPLTIVVADSAGSDDGMYARQIQNAAASLSPVEIRVVDRPDFGVYGSWEGIRWMADQRGGTDGLFLEVVTIPGSTFDLITTPVTAELGVTVDSMNVVGITENVPYTVFTRADAPWGNDLAEMMTWAEDNPGELRYVSIGQGSGPDMAMTLYLNHVGVEVNTSVGGDLVESITAVAAGSGDVGVTLPGQIPPFLDSGRIEVVSCSGNISPCVGPWPEVDNAASILGIENDPFTTNRGLAVPEEVPDEHREWLEALLKAVADDEEFVAAREAVTPGIAHVWVGHDEADELMRDGIEIGRDLLEPLGLIHESVAE